METLLLLLAFPLAWPIIAKQIWGNEITLTEMSINIFGIIVIIGGLWFAGTHSATSDTEIWNGQIISKHRVEDEYIRTYDCNCYDSCSGSGKNRSCTRVCLTC